MCKLLEELRDGHGDSDWQKAKAVQIKGTF